MKDFVHLHTHSDYSLLDGASSIRELVGKAQENGMSHLALTDHGNMFGALKFYKECREKSIVPIVGSEFYLARGTRLKKTGGEREGRNSHLVLLAIDETGYKNLMRLSSLGFIEGFYYRPRIDDELLEQYSQGLICLSACLAGEIPRAILNGQEDHAEKKAIYYRDLFGADRFYLELQNHGIPEQQRVNRILMNLSKKTGISLVATNDVHYTDKSDAHAHDVLICIGTNKKITEGKRIKFAYPEFYFKTGDEMALAFSDMPEALENTKRIAEMCCLEIPLPGPVFPEYEVPEGYSVESYLQKLAREGLASRYHPISEEASKRLEYELSVICSMEFADYFLITWDFIHFARENHIPVGPGRGSGAGSLVAYSLRITDIDPLKYGLLFERFLNPERVSLPDFDIDFCFERRSEVINYVTRKYGKEKVGQIITFGSMKARAAIRDVARVLDFPYAEADRIAKMVPEGPKVTLDDALSSEPALAEQINNSDKIKELFEISRKLEGKARHASTHAAGIVIGREDLSSYVPLYRDAKTGAISTQYTMDYLEECGLVKMDFLGLKTLTIIDKTARMIRKKGIDFYIDRIPENDPATFELLGQGKSTCVFQFESTGMQDVLKRAKPGNINELSDLNALYRPGPMENIDQYVDSKAGRKAVTYPIIELEPILQQTYGVITYQEQVMQIAREIAGYSLGQADILRKAMGKKKKDVMDEQKKKFIEGALQKGFPKAVATKIFDLFVPFAGYGFNKCHSAPYSLLAYQTAFLKANYPAEFMAANLTSEINNTDKMAQYMSEAKSMGIQILAPDVNLSEKEFTVVDGKIVYGLCGVKNVGSSAVDSILQERGTSGPFTNIHNFLERIDLKTVNRKVFEAMILTGVLDKFGENRATLFHSLDRLMEIATRTKENRAYGQESLFDKEQIDSMVKVELERVDEWPQAELLRLERQNLGFFFSGHPMEEFQDIIRRHANLDLSKTDAASPQRVYVLIGILRDLKEIVTRKGNKMAFGSLEDYNGCIELVFFPEVYEKTRAHLVSDNIIAVKGKLDKNRGDPKMLVDEVSKPGELASKKISTIHIRLSKNFQEEETLYELRDFIFRQSGDCTLYLHLKSNGHGEERVVRASPAITVSSDEQALQRLRGYPNVAEVWVE